MVYLFRQPYYFVCASHQQLLIYLFSHIENVVSVYPFVSFPFCQRNDFASRLIQRTKHFCRELFPQRLAIAEQEKVAVFCAVKFFGQIAKFFQKICRKVTRTA